MNKIKLKLIIKSISKPFISILIFSLAFFYVNIPSFALEKSDPKIIEDYRTVCSYMMRSNWREEYGKLKKCFSDLTENTLQTDRLIIEKTCEDDIPALANYLMNPEVIKYLSGTEMKPFENIDDAIKYVENSLRKSTIKFTVKLKDDLTPIGNIDYYVNPTKKQISLGYYFGKDYQGKGYASESVTALTKKILDSIDFGTLCIYYNAKNHNSEKLARKVINCIKGDTTTSGCKFCSATGQGTINKHICSDDSILGFSLETPNNREIKCSSFIKVKKGQ